MTELGERLRAEILRDGPIAFSRFMDAALYHPELGYYRRDRDPFGRGGDFFTAEQLQPVFGRLMAARTRALRSELGSPEDFMIVELGAGRAEMAEAFSEFRYVPVDVGRGELPAKFSGVVFANEFFDALPIDVGVLRGGEWQEMRVGWSGDRFVWMENGPAAPSAAEYLRRYFSGAAEGAVAEANLAALGWIERIARKLSHGYLLAIDYGYTAREAVRFPRGTLMSYRKHQAFEDVLSDPGERDITAHVCFTALEEHARSCGFARVRFENLARTLMDAGEADQFAFALAASTPAEEQRHRLQLKTLLFGMGETFRVLLLRRESDGCA